MFVKIMYFEWPFYVVCVFFFPYLFRFYLNLIQKKPILHDLPSNKTHLYDFMISLFSPTSQSFFFTTALANGFVEAFSEHNVIFSSSFIDFFRYIIKVKYRGLDACLTINYT